MDNDTEFFFKKTVKFIDFIDRLQITLETDYVMLDSLNRLIDEFYKFIKYDDIFNNTAHLKIVKKLYCAKSASKQKLCGELCLDLKTLYRYRIKYACVIKNLIADLGIDTAAGLAVMGKYQKTKKKRNRIK